MPGGRPTDDPKGTLVAVRLSASQVRVLEARAKREGVSLSEALRRCVDDSAARAPAAPRARPPTPEERETFDQVFAAFGLTPRRHRGRRPRTR
jgi:ribosomal protein L12E/L44/L45/RPP1/RPP2